MAERMGERMAVWSDGCEVGLSVEQMGDMMADALVAIQVEQLAVLTVGLMVAYSASPSAASMVA